MTIPRTDALKPRQRLGVPARSIQSTKPIENTTNADLIKDIRVSAVAPTNSQVLGYDSLTGLASWTNVAAAVSGTVSEAPVSVFSAQELVYGAANIRFQGPLSGGSSGDINFSPGGFMRAEMFTNAHDGGAIEYSPTQVDLAAPGIASLTQTGVNLSAIGPANGQHIRVDSEAMLVLSGGGTASINVARARLQTTAATHSVGASVLRVNVESVMKVTGGLQVTGGVSQQDLSLQGYSTHELAIKATFTEPIPSYADGQTEFGYMTLYRAGHNHAANVNYVVEIDTQGAPGYATFRWSDDGGATWDASLVPVQANHAYIHLQEGVTISFSQGSYFVGNRWDFTAIGTANQVELLRADTVEDTLYMRNVVIAVTGAPASAQLLDVQFNYTGVGSIFGTTVTARHQNTAGSGQSVQGASINAEADRGAAAGDTAVTGLAVNAAATEAHTSPVSAATILSLTASFPEVAPTLITGGYIADLNLSGSTPAVTVTALDILSQTAGSVATYNIRQRGTTGVNRLAAPTLIGADASPAAGVALELRSGRLRMAASTNNYIEDSAGNRHITFASDTNIVAVTTSIGGDLRVNDQLGVGTGATAGVRANIATWQALGSGSHEMVRVGLTGTQSADATRKSGIGLVGTYNVNGFILDEFSGIFFNAIVGDVAGGGSVGVASGITSGLQFTNSVVVADSAGINVIPPQGTGAVTLHRGMWIQSQGAAGIGVAVGLEIDPQADADTQNYSIRVNGAAPSFHEPFLTVGAGAIPATSAVLELQSTTGALLLSRMTTTQRDAMTPVNGMMIYNTTAALFQCYEAGAWRTV